MQSGLKPNIADFRDYDFHPSFGNISTPQFPGEYITDAGFGFPNQDFLGEPFGCTNFTQSELANDLSEINSTTPFELEGVTHANAKGGYSVRDSIKAAQSLGWFSYYFNINPHGSLDWFDAIRLAISSGIPEKRSVSIGTMWYPEWMGDITILPLPARLYGNNGWHNYKICGWKIIDNEPMLVLMSWQGVIGDGGFQYISRAVINKVMEVPGTVAFTTTDNKPDAIVNIQLTTWDWLKSLLGFRY